jgi:hypothetical protein
VAIEKYRGLKKSQQETEAEPAEFGGCGTAAALLLQNNSHRQAALGQDNSQWTGENRLLSPEESIRLDAIDR